MAMFSISKKWAVLIVFFNVVFFLNGSTLDSLKSEYENAKGKEFLNIAFQILDHTNEGESTTRLTLLSQITDTALSLKDSSALAIIYLHYSSTYGMKGDYTSSMKYVSKAREMYESKLDEKGMAMCDMNMAVIHIRFLKEYKNARRYLESAIKLFLKYDDKRNIVMCLNNIGNCYLDENKLDSSIIYYKKALVLSKEVVQNDGQILSLNNLGITHKIKGEYEKSLHYFFKVREVLEVEMDSIAYGFNDLNIASVYKKMKSFPLALKYVKNAEIIFLKYEDADELFQAYNVLAELYELDSQHEKSLEYYKKRIVLGDSIFSMKAQQEVNSLKSEYDIQANESKLKIQQLEIDSLEKEKKSRIYINILLVIALIAVVIATFLFFINQRKKLENQKLLNEKNKGELEMRNKELMSYSLLRVQKNTLLKELSESLDEFLTAVKMKSDPKAKKLKRMFNKNVSIEKDWGEFRLLFENVNTGFLENLKALNASLSKNEEKLCIMLKLKMSTKEIASMTNVDPHSVTVARYRIRKKLGLLSEQNLDDYIQNL